MTVLLTAAQMRAAEEAAIASGAVTGLELMERAGQGVVDAIFEKWPELAARSYKAIILCGPGNNGGDGFVVARILKTWGWEVEVCLFGSPGSLPPDARRNYDRWLELGAVEPLDGFLGGGVQADLIVDALFGTGLTRAVEGDPGQALAQIATDLSRQQRLVCIDIQSGLCSDSGRVLGGFERPTAALTVTFHTAKPGHYLDRGPYHSGQVVVVDIGLPTAKADDAAEQPTQLVAPDPHRLSKANQPTGAHKYSHGHALVFSGPMGRSGAARLAARGALRVGAGLVTVAAPGSAMMECASHLTAIMCRRCDGAEGAKALLQDTRLNALCLGPGLGVSQETRDLVLAALAADRPVVLDADALTAFADDPQALFDRLHPQSVLTPHGGEFARLFPDIADQLSAPATRGPAYSKLDATRAAAARAGCVVLFKGTDTVIADPTGAAAINAAVYRRAAPWLATAGSGDVLAGMITGLLARGYGAQSAAETGAWLHVEAARRFGPGLIAEDLPEMLPNVFHDLGL